MWKGEERIKYERKSGYSIMDRKSERMDTKGRTGRYIRRVKLRRRFK
jgi:hypothetical protein